MQVTINFGIANSITKNLPDGTTVGAVLSDRSIMAGLGFGDNVVGKIDGQTQDANRILRNGDHLDVEVRANTKAVKKVASPEAPKKEQQPATEPQSETTQGQQEEANPAAAESSPQEQAAPQA